jgi:hypothetical protein
LDASSRLQLREGLVVDIAPFGRRQLRPPQRGEVFPGISDNIEKSLVGFDNPALKIPDYNPDDVRVDQAADPGLRVCTENLSSDVVVVKSAKDGV